MIYVNHTQYRTHANGPLVTLKHDVPGKIGVSMLFDMPTREVEMHSHAFDHVMNIIKGPVRIYAGNECHVLNTGDLFTVPAHVKHGLVPMTLDAQVDCDHDIRYENGDLFPKAFNSEGVPKEWLDRLTDKVTI
jgi:hypothetical protein